MRPVHTVAPCIGHFRGTVIDSYLKNDIDSCSKKSVLIGTGNPDALPFLEEGGLGFRVLGAGLRVRGLEFGDWGLGFRVSGLGLHLLLGFQGVAVQLNLAVAISAGSSVERTWHF